MRPGRPRPGTRCGRAWAQVAGGRWAVGALAYEAALGLGLAIRVSAAEGPPAAAFLLFDEPRVVDRLGTGPFDSPAPLDWQPGLDAQATRAGSSASSSTSRRATRIR